MNNVTLKLYITGQTLRSEQAVANLRKICETQLCDQYEIEIVDVLEQPQLAEEHKILATPTLVRTSPPPLRRIIGDLSDMDKVLQGLGLDYLPLHSSEGVK
jgi:circadian clock protein KaiB